MSRNTTRSPTRLNESAQATAVPARLLEAASLTFERLEEAGKPSSIKVKGVAGQADVINSNGRFYPLDVARVAVETAQADITAGKFLMLEEHPSWDEPFTGELDDVAARVTALSIDEAGQITYEATLINNECGQNIAALLDAGVRVQASTRAEGVVDYVKASELNLPDLDPEVLVQRITSMTFLGVDFTLNPSVSTTDAALTEHRQPAPAPPKEARIMDLNELKTQHPDLYKQVLAESAKVSQDASVEAELARLKAENDQLKRDALNSVRHSIVSSALTEAALPKLGNAGEINLDERFERQVNDAAMSADSDAAAKDAVNLLITERRALLGQNASIKAPVTNRAGLPAGNTERSLTEAQQAQDSEYAFGINGARALVGL